MSFNWLDYFSDRSPQFLREVKGRLKPRAVTIAAAASLSGQGFIVLYFQRLVQTLLDTPIKNETAWTAYAQIEAGNLRINWQGWWFEIFYTLTWVALTLLLFLGSYLLVKDIAREERRGTFDFVRLSPASSQNVLVGKLLGVPILLYWAIALAIPLHLWAAVSAGLPLLAIMGVYLLLAIACVFVYSFSLLHSLSWGAKAQGTYVMPLVGIIYAVLHGLGGYWGFQCRQLIINAANQEYWSAGLDSGFPDVNDWVVGFTGVLLLGLSTLTVWFWRMCRKRFHHPPLRP
ncbi:MAG: hypothetical protein KME42_13100 [Tildeniella nuda ZEHNDER 1965/U140]|jgi:hypothetical protein|nr:hypothetical protein [Tildeniella nuda ZEHNDER 1965/U140]